MLAAYLVYRSTNPENATGMTTGGESLQELASSTNNNNSNHRCSISTMESCYSYTTQRKAIFAKKVCVRKLKQLRAQVNSDAVSFLQLDRTDIKSYVTLDAAQRQGFTRARLPPKGSESRALTRCPRITNTWLDECVIFPANYSSFASERLLAVVLLEVWWPWRCPWASQVHPSSSVQSV